MNPRAPLVLHPALRDDIGDLVTRRPVPSPNLPQVDPFLFLNHHGPQTYPPNNRGLPFGPHPHRGFETVTFILEGELTHRDTGGHESIIRAGGIQWMTAGRGLVHSELSPESFKRAGGPLEILQLWVNLPSRLKMAEPAYRGLQAADIPVVEFDDGRVRVEAISGDWAGTRAPIASLTGVAMAVVRLAPGASATFPIAEDRSIFLYVVRGALRFGDTLAPAHHLIEMGDGESVALACDEETLVLFGHAEPIGEPVAAYGPFVMNSKAEIEQAIADYRAGLFGAM